MKRKKVIVSACLLGENCRYNGKTKKHPLLEEKLSEYEVIPFCPEAPLFGTPRARIDVVQVGHEKRIIQAQTGKDVTVFLQEEIEKFMQQYPNVDKIVLKSKSPSCGNGTTSILNKAGRQIALGDGIAADLFKQYYDVVVEDELAL